MNDHAEAYRERIAARAAETAACQRQHVWLGYLRLTLVVAGVLVIWFSFHRDEISRWWPLLVCGLFVIVARKHSAVLQRKAEAQRAIRFFEYGLARIEDRWADNPARKTNVDASQSLLADDLDLFRRGGLFDLLDTARTSEGADLLALWLLNPATRETILARQAAIAELRASTVLRERLASCGETDFEQLDTELLAQWGSGAELEIPGALRWIAPVLVLITVASAVWFLATNNGWPLLAIVVLDSIVRFPLKKRVQSLFVSAERTSNSLKLASQLIALWEQQPVESPLLLELQGQLTGGDKSASQALSRLAFLTRMMEQYGNLMVRIFDVPLLYSMQVALAAQRWRRTYGSVLARWLRALAELEALQSLATYSFEHPHDPFPQISEAEPCFEAVSLGHPLIAAAKCVRNDVKLGNETKLLLVSGSNMSGKSTLLRAVGINTVLAMAGAPVRAASLQLTPMHVGASIQLNDSLQEGRSRFYSEILRLRAICELAEERPPVLFLLDELLDGTNSSDRLTGATGIAQALLASGAIGLISTHDLALAEIANREHALRNVHFEERIEDGEMLFDFKLRDGVVTTRNGVALMRMVGLKV